MKKKPIVDRTFFASNKEYEKNHRPIWIWVLSLRATLHYNYRVGMKEKYFCVETKYEKKK